MKKTILHILAVGVFVTLLSGCAANYRPINVSNVNYPAVEKKNGLELAFKYDVLREAGNKKMAKKEGNSSKKVVAIKLTNNTDSDLVIGRDMFFFAGQTKINPSQPQEMKMAIKQNVAGYLPYGLLTLMKLTITKDFQTSVYSIGYVIGPLVTIFNMTTASGSNKRFEKNLKEYSLIDKTVKKGETIFGLMGVSEPGFQAITVKLKSEIE